MGNKAEPEESDGGPDGANGGGGGREKFGFVFDDADDAASAVAADDDDDAAAVDVDVVAAAAAVNGGDDSKLAFNWSREDFSLSVVTILLFISMIAAISWPIDGSPDSQIGTLLKSSDANFGTNRA